MIDIDTIRFDPMEDDDCGELVCSERGPVYHRVAGLIDATDASEIIHALRIARAARQCVKHARGARGGNGYMIEREDFLVLKAAVRGEPEAGQEGGRWACSTT